MLGPAKNKFVDSTNTGSALKGCAMNQVIMRYLKIAGLAIAAAFKCQAIAMFKQWASDQQQTPAAGEFTRGILVKIN